MIVRRSAALVNRWAEMYTRGLPAELRDARRAEIASDLWDQLVAPGPSDGHEPATDVQILVRLLAGVPDDLGWRLAVRGVDTVEPDVEAQKPAAARPLGVLAITGGICIAIGATLFSARLLRGPAVATWSADQALTAIMVALGTVGMLAIVAAAVGFVILYRNLLTKGAAVSASAAAIGAVLFLLDVWPAVSLVPVGFAYLIWDLGRIGILPRWVAMANIASTVGLLVPLLALATSTAVSPVIVLVIPYWITWLAIGESLMHGRPANRGGRSQAV